MSPNYTAMAARMAHKQASLDAQSTIDTAQLVAAQQGNTQGHRVGLYRETTTRAQWRSLFNAAFAIKGTVVAVTYIKDMGEARTMLAQPLEPGADLTSRYVTVWDLELAAYRRVNLDGIIKVTLETGSVDAQYDTDKHYSN